METDHGILRIVPYGSIDYNVIDLVDLVVKCQFAAVYGMQKKVKALKSKLSDWEVQAKRTTMFHTLFLLAIVTIRLLLANLNLRASLCMVVWVVGSLIALVKLMTVHNLASGLRGKMNDLRSSAIILEDQVEEDFDTNVEARCFSLYSLTLLQIRWLFLEIDFCNYDMNWLAVFTIVAPVLFAILCLGL